MLVRTFLAVCTRALVCVCHNSQAADEKQGPEQQDESMIKQTYYGNSNKLAVFIAAAVGTMMLMAVIYCIYNQFYTKHPYTHTELQDTDSSLDLVGLSSSGLAGCGRWVEEGGGRGGRRGGKGGISYGSLSDTPSIITLPPSLSPPPLASPFPPPRPPCSVPLRTISAQELQKNFT